MTALKKYQRLECQGLWRETPEAQRRDVIVSFREASLIISDGRSETALSHWSLPAVTRLNPGTLPALYAPGVDAVETLEIDDRDMIGALETVHDAVEAQRPHPGRMRQRLLAGALLALAAITVFWLPGALITHTAQVVPWAKRQEIGRAVLAEVQHVSGTPCAATSARRPLARLTSRLFVGPTAPVIVVLRDMPVPVAHLPGGILLLNRHLIEDRDGPDVAAGYLLAERIRAETTDPLVPLLHWVGLRATFELLTTGHLPTGALDGYGEALLAARNPAPAEATLVRRFAAVAVPLGPYVQAADPQGRSLTATDPAPKPGTPAPRPVLADDDWVALQGICSP
ncbi:MAG: hypothetical protein GC186_08325 [Rhodobacteraceae bacterium]|nr:hypothetical protein [Paracoccaceae bacterium]